MLESAAERLVAGAYTPSTTAVGRTSAAVGGRLMDRPIVGVRTAVAVVTAVLVWFVASGTGEAFNTMTVRVTVSSASTFGACWDAWCNKPDLFVTFYGAEGTAQTPRCPSIPVVDRVNVGNPPPNDWTCTLIVNRPGKIFIGLYDGDGPNNDNTAGQQVDVAPGVDKSVPVDVENISRGQGASSTYQSQGDDGAISYTISSVVNPAELLGFTSSTQQFRPSAGQQIVVAARATGAPYTRLRIRGYDSAGSEVWNIFGYLDDPEEEVKTFVWQGRDANGAPLTPGTYQLKLEAFDITTGAAAIGPLPGSPTPTTVGGYLTQTITILAPPSTPVLALVGVHPSPKWAPGVGDLGIRVGTSADATISGEVFPSQTCTGAKVADLSGIAVQATQTGTLTWDGTLSGGGPAAVGKYGIKLSGTSGGAPTAPPFVCAQIEVITAPAALVYVQHAPFLARPGQTVELTAKAVDPSGAPRLVGQLSVFGSVQPIPGAAPSTSTTPLRTCTMASTCTATLALPGGHSFFSWMGSAADRDQTTIASTGWRGQRVMDPSLFAQAAGFAIPVDVALTGSSMADTREDAMSFDLLFSVSTDFVWTSTTDRQTVGDALAGIMVRLWGLAGNGAPALTTFMSRPDLVRLYLTPERPVVSWNPQANVCDWTAPYTAWADAIGVLHKTACRDNADPSSRSFSAKLLAMDVVLHELHHALFGLADEYPDGTGGYFEWQPFANVYTTLAGCTAVMGREPSGCTTITERDRVTRMPTGRTFFRLDASMPDIMVDNGTQRFADTSRANWKERECDAGRC
jgi:hypothetical protein